MARNEHALSPDDFAALAKAETRTLTAIQKAQQRQIRLTHVDRWLRACLRESQIIRMGCHLFDVADVTVKKLIAEVYREWAEGAILHGSMSPEERRHRDRLKIEHIYSVALERKELGNVLRALELLCRINGTIQPDTTAHGTWMPAEVLAIRAMSDDDLRMLASRQATRVIDVDATE